MRMGSLNYQKVTATVLGSYLSFTPTFVFEGQGLSRMSIYHCSTTFPTHIYGKRVHGSPIHEKKNTE